MLEEGAIIYTELSPALREEFEHALLHSGKPFSIDAAIPVPLEVYTEKDLGPDDHTAEAVLAAMIRLLAKGEADREREGYYRGFIRAVRPDILDEFTKAAFAKAAMGDFAASEEICLSLRGIFPDDARVAAIRALVLDEQAKHLAAAGRDDEALAAGRLATEAYEDALAGEGATPDILYMAAMCNGRQKQYRRARELFAAYIPVGSGKRKEHAQKRLERIDAASLGGPRYEAAYAALCVGDEKKALEEIHEYLRLHADVWNGWFILGWALRRLERWEEAAAAFEKAIELGGRNANIHNELAICLMEMEKLDLARVELEKALVQQPENAKIINNLGYLCRKMGREEEAQRYFAAAG
jgi:Tfp pilus assembly protein PilF